MEEFKKCKNAKMVLQDVEQLVLSDQTFAEWVIQHEKSREVDLIIKIAHTEHRRWNYAMALDGWSYSEKKNVESKQHDCILKWEDLSQKNLGL